MTGLFVWSNWDWLQPFQAKWVWFSLRLYNQNKFDGGVRNVAGLFHAEAAEEQRTQG